MISALASVLECKLKPTTAADVSAFKSTLSGWSGTSPVRSGTFSHHMPEIWVVTLSALYRAVVLQERRRRNDVKRSQLPLAAPVQIHDRERARQTGVCLVERAILLDL